MIEEEYDESASKVQMMAREDANDNAFDQFSSRVGSSHAADINSAEFYSTLGSLSMLDSTVGFHVIVMSVGVSSTLECM